ncbi:MAG TPA: DNA-formamidopyrimidine glycosylase family protein [Kofleriaceae bacterium]|nr:DNA-formamidopyrimidine glycosylase family protein [Kofleriaceae bacterium]
MSAGGACGVMPEGDSIRRVASRLQPLIGQTLARVTTQGIVRNLVGRTITAVAPHGKHLMIDLDDGTQLRMHLGMNGRVRYYMREDGEAAVARISPGRASLVLVTAEYVAMWIQAPTVEIAPRRAPMRGIAVAALGPDVLADDFDANVAATRALEAAHRMIGEVLLDQRVAAGIGNIWRCESLFVTRIDPRALVGSLSHDQIAATYRAARELMLTRLTAAGPARDRFAVYSRTNKPCPRCEAPIRAYQLGEPPRWTWSCPVCQPHGASGGA